MATGVKKYVHAVMNFVITKQGVIIAQHMVLNRFKKVKKIIITLVFFYVNIYYPFNYLYKYYYR